MDVRGLQGGMGMQVFRLIVHFQPKDRFQVQHSGTQVSHGANCRLGGGPGFVGGEGRGGCLLSSPYPRSIAVVCSSTAAREAKVTGTKFKDDSSRVRVLLSTTLNVRPCNTAGCGWKNPAH